MPLSGVDPLALARLTPQQLADLALSEDQEARRALARGDAPAAWSHVQERDALADFLNRK